MERRLVNIHELAAHYGFKKWTIRSYCSQGRIPYIKIGRRVYFDLNEIEAWLKEHERPARER